MTDLQTRIRLVIQKAKRILVTSHIRPDGDAVGSSLALTLALLDAGKQVQVVLSDGIPESFKHLPGADLVKTEAGGEFDLIICLDCSEMKRTGTALSGYRSPDLVIDHHQTNTAFGTLNLVEPEAAATASLLIHYLPEWGFAITPPIATNLLNGMITDTIGFRTPNTTPEVLRQAADLLEVGVDMSRIYFSGLIRRTYPEAKYWGIGLSNLQRKEEIIWTSLSLTERHLSGYTGSDDADLINMLSSIDDVDIAIVLVEQSNHTTKVSWRGLKPQIDVSKIATQFNGGGHKAAAGAEIDGSLDEVQQNVLAASLQALQHSTDKR